jgi:hypothetical protein
MSKYETLLNILDQLRKEAPQEYKRYYPLENDIEGLNNARSRAYIHLFLKVKFGILDFKKREELIADGPQDGGIDAYYIDNEAKCIYFIQAKFRTNESNFNNREILLKELLQMEVNRIIIVEGEDEKKQPYNNKNNRLI